jgi:myo-inositol 2-dehydrogenase/D-chiro-inositol 1-dehydrogenase
MLRCGLIGYGAWGFHHARVIAADPGARLAGIASRSMSSRAKARTDHPSAGVFADYRKLLSQPDLDAVVVALPSDLHFEAGLAVLEAGRHLLLEKPMCLGQQECEILARLARAQGLVLAVGHEMRLSPLWSRVRDLLVAGEIGQPDYLLIELWRRPYRLGSEGWRYDLDRVGSWILEEPIHFFDLARWYFAGVAEPSSVYARASGSRLSAELHDNITALVEFGPGASAVITQSLSGWEHHLNVKLSGTKGSLAAAWSGATDRTFAPVFSLKRQTAGGLDEVPIVGPPGEVFELALQFARFREAIETGKPPAASAEDGAWAVRMCLAAQQSICQGVPVPFEKDEG